MSTSLPIIKPSLKRTQHSSPHVPFSECLSSSKYFNETSTHTPPSIASTTTPKSALTSFLNKSRIRSFWRTKAIPQQNVTNEDRELFFKQHVHSVSQAEQFDLSFTKSNDRLLQQILNRKEKIQQEWDEIQIQTKLLFEQALKEEKGRICRSKIDVTSLTEEEYHVYNHAMNSGRRQLLFNAELSCYDFLTLHDGNWLNDEVVNGYFKLIQLRSETENDLPKVYSFNSYFYPKLQKNYSYKNVKRWTKKVDLFSFDKILIPCHLGNHWTLLVIDLYSSEFQYFDSMGGFGEVVISKVKKYLQDEHKERKGKPLDIKQFKTVSPGPMCPSQTNCDDCGVFMSMFAECSSRNEPLPFSSSVTSKRMSFFRKRMVVELMVGRLRNSSNYDEELKKTLVGLNQSSEDSVCESDSDFSDLEILE
ncbi:hypothetical protein P9112_005482 [Eukaryota sp. TZLM1-RC]